MTFACSDLLAGAMMAFVAVSPGDVPFVGRVRELTALRAAVRRAAEGAPGAVLIAGEAGGGKSRLVRALLEEPSRPEPLVLRTQCVDLGDPGLPYLAVVDLVRAVQAVGATDSEVASILDGLPVLTRLTDRNAVRDDAVDESRRLQVFDAMTALLAGVGRIRGPVLVAIEDLQWVDWSSAECFRFLLSRVQAERLLVVATVRTDGLAGRPLTRHLVSELGRLPWVQRLDLQPFDATEVAEFLAHLDRGPVDAGVADVVFRRTQGNPYYVQTLAAGALHHGRIDEGMPRGLSDLLVGRLDRLPDDVRTVLRCAAVVGRHAPDRLLRGAAGLSDAAVTDAMGVAVAEGLVTPEREGYSFTHDLLRDAVYDDLLPGERARWHLTVGGVLEAWTAGPAAPAEVAHHFAQAQDAARALQWSIRAADEAMRVLAPGEAHHHLAQALEAWPLVDDPAALAGRSQGRVAVQAARAARLAGEPTQAIEWARRAIQLCDAEGDGSGGVQARAELVRQLVEIDATDQTVGPAQEAVRLAESAGVDASTGALARTVLARALLAARRTDEARPQAERALAEAKGAEVPSLEVEALTTEAFLDEIDGDLEAAARRLRTALLLARAEGELAAELRAHYALASLHYYNGDVGGSLPVLREAMARVTESGLLWSAPGLELRLLHAIALYASGELHASLEAAHAPETRPPDVAAARLAAVGCYAAVACGHPDAVRRLAGLRESWHADPQVALVAGGCEADHLAWEGDTAGAVAVAERAQVHLDTVAGEGMYGGLWLSALGLAALADEATTCRRRRDEAGASAALRRGDVLLHRVEQLVEGGHGRPGLLGPEGRAWHARALAEHARLSGEPAVEEWRRALEAYGYGHVYEQARCHWRLAEALIAAGDRDAARRHAEAAAASAERMQALPLRRAVAATVSQARLGGGETTAESVLTRREQDVLALVAEGLTNREIGKRLFISEKTASVHLSNLMAKLNVSSRTEAVTVAQRRGLLDVL
ncbi:LuxR family transcriptional regulator [Nocardioides gansuensis]|uniref:LuxR family transcriptional regulator n=1 Tax=Nocardioides gansuensis TaxID=2138300 RepID=A0A2T8FE37_9ACTN|nr:LuxR family transcriptional regulator [Nocardioides gansuensis]